MRCRYCRVKGKKTRYCSQVGADADVWQASDGGERPAAAAVALLQCKNKRKIKLRAGHTPDGERTLFGLADSLGPLNQRDHAKVRYS